MSLIGKLVRKSQATLFWCMHGLPKAQREAIYTLYAFCRHLDNVVDGNMPQQEKCELLNAWQRELENIYDKKVPATDIGRKIYKNCMRFKIQKNDFSEILNCTMLDCPKPLQAPDFNTFYHYCYGTAEMPAYIMLAIIGELSETQKRELAQSFGRAMMITNILKDVKEDAMAGHLYMPAELLQKAGVNLNNPMDAITDKNLIAVREQLARLAAENFDKAFALLAKGDKKKMLPLKVILNIFRRYFDIMQNRGWEIMSPRPHIGRLDKLAIAYKTMFGK